MLFAWIFAGHQSLLHSCANISILLKLHRKFHCKHCTISLGKVQQYQKVYFIQHVHLRHHHSALPYSKQCPKKLQSFAVCVLRLSSLSYFFTILAERVSKYKQHQKNFTCVRRNRSNSRHLIAFWVSRKFHKEHNSTTHAENIISSDQRNL